MNVTLAISVPRNENPVMNVVETPSRRGVELLGLGSRVYTAKGQIFVFVELF